MTPETRAALNEIGFEMQQAIGLAKDAGGNVSVIYLANWSARLQALAFAPVSTAGWQPIETAPKDGETWILGAAESGYITTPLRIAAICWSRHYEAWMTHSHDRFTDGGYDAIYWLPLPSDPPAEKDQ